MKFFADSVCSWKSDGKDYRILCVAERYEKPEFLCLFQGVQFDITYNLDDAQAACETHRKSGEPDPEEALKDRWRAAGRKAAIDKYTILDNPFIGKPQSRYWVEGWKEGKRVR